MQEDENLLINEKEKEPLTRSGYKRLIFQYLEKRKNIFEQEEIPDDIDTNWGN